MRDALRRRGVQTCPFRTIKMMMAVQDIPNGTTGKSCIQLFLEPGSRWQVQRVSEDNALFGDQKHCVVRLVAHDIQVASKLRDRAILRGSCNVLRKCGGRGDRAAA